MVGVLNTLVGLLVIYGCKWIWGLGDAPANAIGYLVALANSFYLNRTWTFASHGAVLPAMLRFLIVFLLAYLVNLLVVLAMVHQLGVNGYLAQAVGIGPYTVLSYLGSRHYVFPAPSASRD